MSSPLISRTGYEGLEREREQLKNRARELRRMLGEHRDADPDLHVNVAFQDTRVELMYTIPSRLERVNQRLEEAVIIEESFAYRRGGGGLAGVGSRVTVDFGAGGTDTYLISGTGDAAEGDTTLSHESPLGAALIGHRQGDEVTFQPPGGTRTVRLLAVEPGLGEPELTLERAMCPPLRLDPGVVGTVGLVERYPPGAGRPAAASSVTPGGSGILMAATTTALGHTPRVACHLGADPAGDQLRERATSLGIDLRIGERDGATPRLTAVADGPDITLPTTDDRPREAIDPGAPDRAVQRALTEAELVLLGDAPAGTIRAALGALGADALVVSNLSAGYSHLPDDLLEEVLSRADLITMNHREHELLSTRHALSSLWGVVFVTDQRGSVEVRYRGEAWEKLARAEASPEVVDTHGAGDAFATTLAVGLAAGRALRQAVPPALAAARRMCALRDPLGLQRGAWSDLAP